MYPRRTRPVVLDLWTGMPWVSIFERRVKKRFRLPDYVQSATEVGATERTPSNDLL